MMLLASLQVGSCYMLKHLLSITNTTDYISKQYNTEYKL